MTLNSDVVFLRSFCFSCCFTVTALLASEWPRYFFSFSRRSLLSYAFGDAWLQWIILRLGRFSVLPMLGMTHVSLIPMLQTSQLTLMICDVSSQSPANFLFVWQGFSFTFFDLSMPLQAGLALVSLVISKEKLKLLLSFISFVKLLKFISLVLYR